MIFSFGVVLTREVLVQGALAGKHVTRVDCGTQHAMAQDKEGFVYAWGFGGYSRLGLGDTKDRYLALTRGDPS